MIVCVLMIAVCHQSIVNTLNELKKLKVKFVHEQKNMDSGVTDLRMRGHKSLLEQRKFPTAAQNTGISGPNIFLSVTYLSSVLPR